MVQIGLSSYQIVMQPEALGGLHSLKKTNETFELKIVFFICWQIIVFEKVLQMMAELYIFLREMKFDSVSSG